MKFRWMFSSPRRLVLASLLTAAFLSQGYCLARLLLATPTAGPHRAVMMALSLAVLVTGALAVLWSVCDARQRRVRALLDSVERQTGESVQPTQSGDDIDTLSETVQSLAVRLDSERRESDEQRLAMRQANHNYMQMLGFVASELRSTVSAAHFNAHLLKDGSYGSMTAEQTEGIEHILEALESLDEITKNYLQLSRIEKGEMQVNRSDADLLEDIVRPVLSGFEAQLNKRDMPVSVNLPVGLRIPVDVALLRVVYENLLGNALRHGSPSGRIELTATTGSDWVTLSVFNEGKEVPENALPSLFRKFQHYESAGDPVPKGPGLGLFLVQQIVSVHGGKVRLDSEAGSGTRVSFTLPL